MDTRRAMQACWNLRHAALFAAGPIAGLVLLALTFGMTIAMQRLALGMAAFSLILFGILIKGEYDRLAHRPRL